VVDIAKIVVMVASRLLRKGMYPKGLWRSLRPAPVLSMRPDAAGSDPAQSSITRQPEVAERLL
jgi:hypothetical protein